VAVDHPDNQPDFLMLLLVELAHMLQEQYQ
jgi:hypothetical protein